ncbi:NAD(P)/FAD-dependent oxidoreductase [Mycetocola miduiensis]|uniref:NADH dehydrogenase n=1 Tax=Mycetocola miduiensis TaxID=995034 RepID=A0A1I5ACR6_9MICO|nr:FAD-dependent oxidoreductase [Mycetocola miduiensis]SFN60160.1 NADH dehydrogenase [Mycetocola miduiensis]
MIGSAVTTVVVVGAGYAGVICANRLRSSMTADEAAGTVIQLINPSPLFYERIRLHEIVAGSRKSAAIPLADMLHPDIDVVLGTAVRIDATVGSLTVRSGDETLADLQYDTLVYAVGSTSSAHRVPGAAENSYAVGDPATAEAAARVIADGSGRQRIVIVGGGFTGVETASEAAQQWPDAEVTLVTNGPIVGSMRGAARRKITRKLETLGVTILERSPVASVAKTALLFADGPDLPFDVCLWTASFSVPELASGSGLDCDEIGRLRVDEHLRSPEFPNILGAGDAVRLPDPFGRHLRMGCAAALPLGGAAAATILAARRGTPLPVASVGFLLQCISLGRQDGYVQVVRADDSPRPLAFSGWLGARIKEAICRLTVTGPQREAGRPGAYWAPKGPKVSAVRTVVPLAPGQPDATTPGDLRSTGPLR